MQARRNETELKLIASAGFELPRLDGGSTGVVSANEEPALDLCATYYDTPDMQLMRHGITLRYRTGEGNGPLWTLKLPANGDLASRSELEFTGEPDAPPSGARDLLRVFLNRDTLSPSVEIRTHRRRWALAGEDGARLAELVDDQVSVVDDGHVREAFREIEIEADGIDRKHLEKIATKIRKAGARPEQRSKASRALEALHKLPPDDAVRVSPKDPAGAAVQPAIAVALRRLLTFDPYARLGEVEGVHQLRVAARRLRSVLRTFAPLIDQAKAEPVIEDLRWLGQALGEVRDLDVFEENLLEQAGDEAMPVIDALSRRRDTARVALNEDLNSQRYMDFIRRVTLLTTDDTLLLESPGKVREVLPRLVRRTWKKLRKSGRALTLESPEEDFHRVRILAKRTRYSAETVAGYMRSKQKKQLEDFAERAAAVQTVLGEHQDAVFAQQIIGQVADERPDDAWLVRITSTLLEPQRAIADERRRDFFGEWKRLDRKKNTKWGK